MSTSSAPAPEPNWPKLQPDGTWGPAASGAVAGLKAPSSPYLGRDVKSWAGLQQQEVDALFMWMLDMLGGSITLSPVELDNLYEKYRQNKMGYVETFVSAETNAITIRIREDEVF